MRGAPEWNAVIRLAIARYRDTDPELALMQFLSDRRRAGLGALDVARPRRPSPVRNGKTCTELGKGVRWMCSLDYPPRQEYAPFEPVDSPLDDSASGTCQIIMRRARTAALWLDIPVRELQTQLDRDVAARRLRALRKQLRRVP